MLLRLAEVLGRLSLAFDIANDYPHGKAVRSTVLAVELGARAGCSVDELRDTYWVTLLGYLGGTGFAHEQGLIGAGDDRAVRSAMSMFSLEAPFSSALEALQRIAPDASPVRRLKVLASILTDRHHVDQFHHAICDASTQLTETTITSGRRVREGGQPCDHSPRHY
jgi:hypothetical protein